MSTAADQTRQIDHQEQRQEDRGDESKNEAEPRDDDADHAPGCVGDALRYLLHIRLGGLGRRAVRVQPRAERRVRRDVLDHPRQGVDEVPEAPGQRREQQQGEDDGERDESEDQRRRARAPPEREMPLHQAYDGLEHEREEQRQKEGHHRFPDVDERPREADDGCDEEHRPHREIDAERARSLGGFIGASESRL